MNGYNSGVKQEWPRNGRKENPSVMIGIIPVINGCVVFAKKYIVVTFVVII
jgi:hypothetical protein